MKKIWVYIVFLLCFSSAISQAKSIEFSQERKIYRNGAGNSKNVTNTTNKTTKSGPRRGKNKVNNSNDSTNNSKPKLKSKNHKVSYKTLDKKEIAKRLNTTEKDFHENIKDSIKERFSDLLEKRNLRNPNICVEDGTGRIVLVHPSKDKKGIKIITDVLLEEYKR